MYANQMVIPSRDSGKEENGLHSNLSNLGLEERVSRPKDCIPCPRSTTRAAMEKSLPSTHDSKSMHTGFQSWVQHSTAQMSSSIDNDTSLNTCLNRAQGLSKGTRQMAYEQKQLLTTFPIKLQGDIDEAFPDQSRGDKNQEIQELAKKLEECEKEKTDGKNEVIELRQQVDQLSDENQRLCSIVHRLQRFGDTDSLKAQWQNLAKDLKNLSDEKKILQQKLDDSERRENEKAEELKKLEKTETAVGPQEVSFLRQKMESLKEENKQLTLHLSEKADAVETEKRKLLEDLSRRSIRGRKLEEELSGSKEKVESLQEQLRVFKSNEIRIKTEAAALKQKNQEMDTESKRLRKFEKDSKQKEENFTSIIQQLQKQLEDSKKDYSNLEEQRKSLKAKMEDMGQENVVLKRKLQEAEKQALKLAQQNPPYEVVANQASQRREDMQQKDKEINYYSQACRHFQLQLQQLQTASTSDNEKLRRYLNEARATASANMAKLTQTERQYEEFKVAASKKDAQISEFEKKLRDVSDQIELYKIQVNDFKKDFNDERKRANDLKSQLDDEKAENRELKLRISKLDHIKLEEDEKAFDWRTWNPNEHNAARPPAPNMSKVDGMNMVYLQARQPNAGERTVNSSHPPFDFSMDLSNSGRHEVRASVPDWRHNLAQDASGGLPRFPTSPESVQILFQ